MNAFISQDQSHQFQYTDIILTIKPEFTEPIRTQKKNHEYWKYLIQPTVTQFWLYETEPVKKIRYIITIGPIQTPGQGSDAFDKGLKESKFGYPILALDQLNNPLNKKDMKCLIGLSPPLWYEYASAELLCRYPVNMMHWIFEKEMWSSTPSPYLWRHLKGRTINDHAIPKNNKKIISQP